MSAAGVPPRRSSCGRSWRSRSFVCVIVGYHDDLPHAGELPGTARPRHEDPRRLRRQHGQGGPVHDPRQRHHLPLPRERRRRAARHLHAGPARQGQDDRLPRRARADHRGRTGKPTSCSRRAASTASSRTAAIPPSSPSSATRSTSPPSTRRAATSSTSRGSAARRSSSSPTRTRSTTRSRQGRFRAELHDRLVGLALSARHDDDRLRGPGRRADDPPGPRHRDRGRRRRRRGPADRRLRRLERGGADAAGRPRHLWRAARGDRRSPRSSSSRARSCARWARVGTVRRARRAAAPARPVGRPERC